MEKVIVQEADRDVLEVLEAALLLEGFDVYAVPQFEESFLEFIDKTPHYQISQVLFTPTNFAAVD